MRFERLLRLTRDQRVRIDELEAAGDRSEDDLSVLIVEQALYDSRLVELARMLDVPLPHAMPADDGLFADHRAQIEDRLAEAGADVRAR